MLRIKKPFLFCSTYSPLILLLIVLQISFVGMSCALWVILLSSLGAIGIGYSCLYYALSNPSTGSKTYCIRSVENKNDLMHTYLMPYIIFIVSFVGLSNLNEVQIASIIILFILLYVVYIRSDLFLFDIILVVLGYNYFKISTDHNVFIAITKENLYEYKNKEITFKLINKNILKYDG